MDAPRDDDGKARQDPRRTGDYAGHQCTAICSRKPGPLYPDGDGDGDELRRSRIRRELDWYIAAHVSRPPAPRSLVIIAGI